MHNGLRGAPGPPPLGALLTDFDACLHDMLAFIGHDPELSALPGGSTGALSRWLPALLNQALGAPVAVSDPHAVRACLALRAAPDLEARFVNYVTGTLRLHHVPVTTVAALRTALLATIRALPHQRCRDRRAG